MLRKTLQLTMPKIGIAWMFALLTVNFNRVAIYDLGVAALVVSLILGIYPLFAPTQPLFARFIDRRPLLGFRRGPYLLIGMLAAGAIFPLLPWVALELRAGNAMAVVIGIVLMVIFGLGIALIANTYLDLVAETTDERSRSGVFAVAWTAQTAAIVLWAFVFQQLMPTLDLQAMQNLYNLTPLVCLFTTLLGIVGLERRLTPAELLQVQQDPPRADPVGNPLAALRVLRTNRPAGRFFSFVFLAITAIFLQDAVLEVYGAQVLGMSVAATATLQQVWNGAVLIAMLITSPVVAILAARLPAASGELPAFKRTIATAGGLVATLGLGALALTAFQAQVAGMYAALVLMGLGAGVFTAVVVTMMSDMTIEGATGRYLGLWSMAQAFATSFAFVASGALYSGLVETALLSPSAGFAAIFGVEGLTMLAAVVVLQTISVAAFRGVAKRDLGQVAI